ncbi:MAG TPA: dTDP-4-dehydrorhamnose 3,5-epimerase [Treponema sp.]|nr:dTDP-4-dehydrorhamnose 3,5-epimerase [Treponema sp.]
MAFEFNKCFAKDGSEIEGLCEIQPKIFGDNRGYFLETYSERDFFAAGLTEKFVQDNQSKSSKGVLRGLHFQTKHPQGKLVRALQGRVYDVAVDLRHGSRTFGKYYGIILDAEKQNQFYIPRGFAHGFYVLTEEAVFAYKCTDFYDPSGEGGLMWNDPTIGIDWKAVASDITEPNLSEKDTKHPSFDLNGRYFDKSGKWIGPDADAAKA